MAEEAWIDEGGAPPKKRGIPGWLWFCGGGCALLFVAGVVLALLLVRTIKEGTDPELQWERLGQALPYDVRGEHLQLLMGLPIGVDMYILRDDRGFHLMIFDLKPSQASDRLELFSPDFDGGGSFFGFGGMEDPLLGTVDVQGRELPLLRYYQGDGDAPRGPGGPQTREGHSAMVDLTAEGDAGGVMMMLQREHSAEEPISDDEIREVLAPFRIGPDYVPPPPGPPAPLPEAGPGEDGR